MAVTSLDRSIAQKQQSWVSNVLGSQTFWVFIAVILACVFLSFASAWELGEGLVSFQEGLKGEHGAFLYGVMSTLKGLGSLGEVEEGVVVIKGAKALERQKRKGGE